MIYISQNTPSGSRISRRYISNSTTERNIIAIDNHLHFIYATPVLIILFLLFSSILFAQETVDSVYQQKHWTISNCVNEFNWKDTIGTEVGYQYWFFDKDFIDGRTLKMSAVAPHSATHKPHTHSEDEFFFVLEGMAEFYLNGQTKTGEKYSAFYCPRNSIHGIKNVGDSELKYLVIKKYEK